MKTQELTTEELIRRVEMGKHDIKMRVRAIVLDPIQSMDEDNSASAAYLKEQYRQHNVILKSAESVMGFFSKKWRNIRLSEEEQFKQLEEHLSDVDSKWIPEIRSIVSFYKLCLANRFYFTDTDGGKDAMALMTDAVNNVDKVCKELEELGKFSSDKPIESGKYNLLEIIQEVLDRIKSAYVFYEDEVLVSTFFINTDKDIFQNRVLLNIRENIEKHAFGTRSYINKHVWEKKVAVSIRKAHESFIISISNNGTPYKGNPQKIFDYGYCYGEKKHSGIGMNSALVHMQQLGGGIEFESSPDSVYPVTFILTLPQNYE